jgi:hypothetical protein
MPFHGGNVSNRNRAQNVPSHSQAGCDFTAACQQPKTSAEVLLARQSLHSVFITNVKVQKDIKVRYP